MDKLKIFDRILTVSLIVGIFALGFMSSRLYESRQQNPSVELKIDSNCSGLNLVMTSQCLKDQLSTFYFYNSSQIGKELSLDELKKFGGVCHQYAGWYYDNAIRLGFNAERVIMKVNDNMSHEIAIMSNSEGYCSLDMENINCIEFSNQSEVKNEK